MASELDKSADIKPQGAELPTIGELLGTTSVLPGEQEDVNKAGLALMVNEFGAKTTLQVYLVEKIYDCLWWIRRYEDQKRVTIIAEMARQTKVGFKPDKTQEEVDIREAFMVNDLNAKVLKALGAIGHTPESLKESAYSKKREDIMQLDQQIALQAKILAGFQGSFELAFNRKLNTERLKLQNELMRRDLTAIEEPKSIYRQDVSDVSAVDHDKPKAARRKPK
jgi:hypothetical protein